MKEETLAAVRRILGSDDPHDPSTLNGLDRARISGRITDAWIDCEIAGFPDDESEKMAAMLWATPPQYDRATAAAPRALPGRSMEDRTTGIDR